MVDGSYIRRRAAITERLLFLFAGCLGRCVVRILIYTVCVDLLADEIWYCVGVRGHVRGEAVYTGASDGESVLFSKLQHLKQEIMSGEKVPYCMCSRCPEHLTLRIRRFERSC
jgi:hypothetical protein